MMFQLATGKLPFPGTSFGEVLIGHLQLPPPNPRDLCPDIPEDYEKVILKAISKKQEDRQQTMRELHDEIKACMDRLGISAELPVATEADMPAPQQTSSLKLQTMAKAQQTRAAQTQAQTRAASQPNITPPAQPTFIQAPPQAPAKSNTGMIIGIAALVLILIGGVIGFAVYSNNKREEAERQAAIQAAELQRKLEVQKAIEDEKKKAEAERLARPVTINVTTDPIDATITAQWDDKEKGSQQLTGPAPRSFKVQRDAKVHFIFEKSGYVKREQDEIADQDKPIAVKLEAEKKAATAATGGKKPKGDGAAPAEEPLDVSF